MGTVLGMRMGAEYIQGKCLDPRPANFHVWNAIELVCQQQSCSFLAQFYFKPRRSRGNRNLSAIT